jgi:FMN phosphatase YigB (HAD superfamily)
MTKTISIDFWGTIAKSHPFYKKARALYWYENWGKSKGAALETVEEIVRDTEKWWDFSHDTTGRQIRRHQAFSLILWKLGWRELQDESVYRQISDDLDSIFSRFPVEFFDENTRDCLFRLAENFNLVIVSNTAFISGKLVTRWLEDNGVSNLFSDFVYSDETGFPKPNVEGCRMISPPDFHVGDNLFSDGEFARRIGAEFVQINSNDKSIKDAVEFLNGKRAAKDKFSFVKRFAGHEIYDAEDSSFSKNEYSQFKHGSRAVAQKFGFELAAKFIASDSFDQIARAPEAAQIVVAPSPYNFVPTATFAMKNAFVYRLNVELIKYNLAPAQEVKIHRTNSYNQDYGQMNVAERENAISAEDFHIDKNFVRGKLVLFLDDVRITGAHERRVLRMIDKYNLECDYLFVYYASLEADLLPNIENVLNYHFVKSVWDIDWIIKNQGFCFNTRAIKYILNAPDEDFIKFINQQTREFQDDFYNYAIGNKYHQITEFQGNLEYLNKLLFEEDYAETARNQEKNFNDFIKNYGQFN